MKGEGRKGERGGGGERDRGREDKKERGGGGGRGREKEGQDGYCC